MKQIDRAIKYVRENLTHPCEVDDITDLLEEYGQDNDLPEMWWTEFYDIDEIIEML